MPRLYTLLMNLSDTDDKESRKDLIQEIKNLINKGASVNETNGHATPLHLLIVKKAEVELIKFLLQKGAHVNVQETESGDTPLLWAVQNHDNLRIRLLFMYGADFSIANKKGETPFSLAVSNNQEEVVSLLKHKDGQTEKEKLLIEEHEKGQKETNGYGRRLSL